MITYSPDARGQMTKQEGDPCQNQTLTSLVITEGPGLFAPVSCSGSIVVKYFEDGSLVETVAAALNGEDFTFYPLEAIEKNPAKKWKFQVTVAGNFPETAILVVSNERYYTLRGNGSFKLTAEADSAGASQWQYASGNCP